MKHVFEESAKLLEASQKEYEDAIASNLAPAKRKLMKNAKPHQEDPNDPTVLVRGFGRMRKSQAERLGMQHEAFNPLETYGMKGKSAQDMAGKWGEGPNDPLGEAIEVKVQMTMPLFIRILEWAKEEAKDDVALHKLAERLAAVNTVADMHDYEELLKESINLT